ncbi:MAG: tetratricopeptide repeat protein [Saprospiraceae bacterium]
MNYTRVVLKEKKAIDKRIELLKTVREPSKRIELLRVIIKGLQYHQPEVAREYAQELLDLGLQKREDEMLGIACNVFAIAEIQHGDFRKAQLYCYQALDALSDKSEQFIVTCKNLAEILTSQGKYDDAYEYLLLSQETQIFLNIKQYEPFTNAQIAKIFYRKGKYEEAFDICISNLRNYDDYNRLDGWEGMTYHVMGLIYAAQKDFKQSLKSYFKAVEIWEKLGNPYQTTGLYSNIGSSYIYQNNMEAAEEYFEKALKVDKEHGGNTKMQSLIYQNLAIISFRSKKTAKAKSYYDMALRLCKMINDKLGEMQLLYNMSMMYDEEPDKAIELYTNSLRIAMDIQDTRFIMYNNESLSKIYAAQKDYQNAYKHKSISQELERELFGIEKTKAIKSVEQQYQNEWQAKEMQLLKNRNEELKTFVQKATKEIKSPLKMMNTMSKILARRYEEKLDHKAQEYLSEITKCSFFLEEIMQSLQHYAVIDINVNDFVPIDTTESLVAAIQNLEQEFIDSNVKVFSSPLPIIRCNPDILTQLFQNLIENAIKFGHVTNPIIEIQTDENFNNIIVSIKDNGIGIATEDTERVLGIFEKVELESTYKGNGIGLAICDKIMKSINGELWIESTLGEETTVFLKFPK